MSVAVIVPWRNSSPDRERSRDYVVAQYVRSLYPDEVVFVDDPDPDDFNRGRAVAEGVRQTTSDTMVFADADIWVPESALLQAVALAPSSTYVVPFVGIRYLNDASTRAVLDGYLDADSPWEPEHLDFYWGARGSGACNVVTRSNYEASGGFDPRFRGWGFEDSAWDQAVTTMVGAPATWLDAWQATHFWHPSARVEESDQYRWSQSLARRYEGVFGDRAATWALVEEGLRMQILDQITPGSSRVVGL